MRNSTFIIVSTVQAICAFFGAFAICYGIWQWSEPAAIIVGGIFLVLIAYASRYYTVRRLQEADS